MVSRISIRVSRGINLTKKPFFPMRQRKYRMLQNCYFVWKKSLVEPVKLCFLLQCKHPICNETLSCKKNCTKLIQNLENFPKTARKCISRIARFCYNLNSRNLHWWYKNVQFWYTFVQFFWEISKFGNNFEVFRCRSSSFVGFPSHIGLVYENFP